MVTIRLRLEIYVQNLSFVTSATLLEYCIVLGLILFVLKPTRPNFVYVWT